MPDTMELNVPASNSGVEGGVAKAGLTAVATAQKARRKKGDRAFIDTSV
jgi:hypothetical protein